MERTVIDDIECCGLTQLLLVACSGGGTGPMCGAQTRSHLHPMNPQRARLERAANTSE